MGDSVPPRPRILVVDDDPQVRGAWTRYLGGRYDVASAGDGAAALALLTAGPFDAMLCDIRMPGMSGIELLPRALAHDPDLAVIMLTAVGEPGSAIACLRRGAVDYLIKPVELDELDHALESALRQRRLQIDRREMERWLAREVAEKTKEIESQARGIEALAVSVLVTLVDALEPRDAAGRTHSMRVANLAAHLAAELGLSAVAIGQVETAARLHDIGRLALRDDRMRPVAPEPPPEVSADAAAPAMAAQILAPLQRYPAVVEAITFQQERWDGRGRPVGLAGERIPVAARIVAAANLCDELTAGSDGSRTMSGVEALAALRPLAGTLLDPSVVEALARVLARQDR